ncbi:MAG: polyprenyl synthetase family protein [Spirochaetaceae bacterium]
MLWDDFPAIKTELGRVQEVIDQEIAVAGGGVSEALGDLARRDAKLLRPAFTLLPARIKNPGQEVPERIIRIAAAVEMLHMASLIHDDIVDGAEKRRGHQALHLQHGSRRAVLMGDFLFTRCFSAVSDCATPQNARMLSTAVARIVSSEMAEMRDTLSEGLSVRRYLHRVIGKTAVLFTLSFHLGATEADLEEWQADALRRIGYNIGVGFQIVDDILDLEGDPNKTGKPVGTDLKLGVVTLPVILALKRNLNGHAAAGYSPEALEMGRVGRLVLKARRQRSVRQSTVKKLQEAVSEAGGISAARRFAETYTHRAAREIERLPASDDRDALSAITGRLLARVW